MILHDGTDTRAEAARPGPFCDGLSVLLHASDAEDEARGDFTVYGTGRRFGRRVLWCDTQGFMSTMTYPNADAASDDLNEWADAYDYPDEEYVVGLYCDYCESERSFVQRVPSAG